MAYILEVRDDINSKELLEVAENILEKGGELVMTAGEKLIEEGEIRNMRKSIKLALFNRFNLNSLEVNDKLDKIEDLILLENLFNNTFQVQSSDEFITILNDRVK